MDAADVRSALFNAPKLEEYIHDDKLLIEAINARKYKAGGSIAKIPENPKSRSEILLNNMEKSDLAILSLKLHEYQLFIVNHFLQSITLKSKKWPEAKQMIIDRYIKRYSQVKMEDKYGYDRTQIYRNINKYIDWYVEHYNTTVLKENNG